MVGLVVMLFHFLPRVLQVVNLDLQSELPRNSPDLFRQLGKAVNLFELVENAVFTSLGRILQRQGQALHGVTQRQEAPLLMSPAEGSQRMPNHCLTTEAVNRSAKRLDRKSTRL